MIALWWIGEGAEDRLTLGRIRADLMRQFQQPVAIWHSAARPVDTFDPRRRQHSSRDVLKWLVAACPEGASRVVGLTDVDLFIPVLTFVFGEAQLEGPAAVVSTARLVDAASSERTLARISKECVHEVAHTFGLVHCHTAGCVMTRSTSVQAVDAKGGELCVECRDRYAATKMDGQHV